MKHIKLYEEFVNENEFEITEAGEFAGWIAFFGGKKLEITKDEAKDLWAAKLLAIKKLNVPKSKQGLLAISPAVDESVNEAQKKLPKFKNIPSWAKYVAQHSDGEWFFYEEAPTMIRFKSGGGAWKQDGNQISAGVKTDGKDWDKRPTYYYVKNGKITESVNEAVKVDVDLAQITVDVLADENKKFHYEFYITNMERDMIKDRYGKLPRGFAGPTTSMLAGEILSPLAGDDIYTDDVDLVKGDKTVMTLKPSTTWADVKKALKI